MVGAWQEGSGAWFGKVTFTTLPPSKYDEAHHTKGYPTMGEALAAANALSVEHFPPGEPRES